MPYRLVFGAQLRENAALRQSFFSLAEQIFGISFAEWHRGGYWQQSYLPYALVEGEEVVANVSVNTMEFLRFGERKRYVQLGTVMTAPRFRGQGLARQLLEHVLLEWESCCQGIYLYANDTVLNFYPKFGFQPQEEYAFFFPLSQRPGDFSRIDPCTKEGEALLRRCYQQGNPFSCCSMQENFSLLMFYCGASLRNDIYYSPGRDAICIAQPQGERLLCYDIFCSSDQQLQEILEEVCPPGISQAELGFSPCSSLGAMYSCQRIFGQDETLFVRSRGENPVAGHKMRLPLLSHA